MSSIMLSAIRSAVTKSACAGSPAEGKALANGARRLASSASGALSHVRIVPIESGRLLSTALLRKMAAAGQVRGFAVTSTANVAAKATTTTKKTAKKTAKKTVKKAAPKKKAAKKVKAKAKAKPKKKAAPKKRAVKVLTLEEKKKQQVRALKKVALLKEPSKLPEHVWILYVTENFKDAKPELVNGRPNLGPVMANLGLAFKALPESELQRLRNTVETNRVANAAAYKAWVEAHTAAEIADANRARAYLKRLGASRKSAIADERQPKRPLNSFAQFSRSRWATGELAGRPLGEAAKSVAADWKSLSPAQRQPYEDLARTDGDRYEDQVKAVLGRTVNRSASP